MKNGYLGASAPLLLSYFELLAGRAEIDHSYPMTVTRDVQALCCGQVGLKIIDQSSNERGLPGLFNKH